MEKRFVRSRGLLAIVVLTITAGMCIVSPVHAGSASSLGEMSIVAPHGAAASGAPCNFVLSLKTCVSTDPTVAYTSYAHGDTSHCTFAFEVTWGDGGSSANVQANPTVGPHLIGNHKYAAPGVYTITVNVQLTARSEPVSATAVSRPLAGKMARNQTATTTLGGRQYPTSRCSSRIRRLRLVTSSAPLSRRTSVAFVGIR